MLTKEQIAADKKLCEEIRAGFRSGANRLQIALPEYLAEVERLSAEVDRLKDALQSLHDYQNGPPLPSYEKPWGEAMMVAEQLLAAGKGKV